MKKLFVMLSLVLATALGAYALTAEEIVGKWESNTIKIDPTPEMPMSMQVKMIFTFEADGSAVSLSEQNMSIQIDANAYADIFFKQQCKASYTVAGDSITIVDDPATLDIVFTEDDVRIRGIEDAAMAVQAQEGIFSNMQQNVQAMKQAITESTDPNDLTDVINNVLVTGNKMICNIDGKIVNFKRKKK